MAVGSFSVLPPAASISLLSLHCSPLSMSSKFSYYSLNLLYAWLGFRVFLQAVYERATRIGAEEEECLYDRRPILRIQRNDKQKLQASAG